LEEAGTNAILVGETLVAATDIRRTIRNLLGETEG
jgi:indole-3-glycerol phosphate synthase